MIRPVSLLETSDNTAIHMTNGPKKRGQAIHMGSHRSGMDAVLRL